MPIDAPAPAANPILKALRPSRPKDLPGRVLGLPVPGQCGQRGPRRFGEELHPGSLPDVLRGLWFVEAVVCGACGP